MNGDVIVVGGGVIGLTTALVLAENGRRVRLWTRDPVARTTSAVAGALFWPYRIEPERLVGAWLEQSLTRYEEMARRPDETGVRVVPGVMADTSPDGLGSWASRLGELREAREDELPDGYRQGLRAAVPLIDMPTHLRYLKGRLRAAGGTVEVRTATALREPAAEAPVVVNCSGLGARELAADASVRPVRGQLVVVANPGIDEWFVSAVAGAAETTYMLPQPYGVLLGGTSTDNAWDLSAHPADAAAIVARCARIRPDLAGARVLEHRVGLRPARPRVRLEAVPLPGGGRLVHNYGHGGAGVTVAWGCAEDAARLVAGPGPAGPVSTSPPAGRA
ncbi:NAD(P)/FAD-dependent oxidoreductase [Streptomyces liangshanensis]|uniref:D-amino-acid oxidase n=1 Tax=Streptomyces liangshanensis TaxID=2717324 RepID=A0A6G9GTP1_9ACTN|nr:FAD-dependent oxidoreductase [Streptomyces liangshanensis]QIQ01633.1 FAD-binding oxidoreductase [Streptomyces liangshanensis]